MLDAAEAQLQVTTAGGVVIDEVGGEGSESASEIEGSVLTIRSYEEEVALARAVRMRVLEGAAIVAPIAAGGWLLLGEEVLGNPVLIGIWLIALFALVRAFVYPLDHTHLVRSRTSPKTVLAAGGLPEAEGEPPLSEWDRRLATLDLIDELGAPRLGFWSSRLGRFAARWIPWLAAALWLAAGLTIGVLFGWAEASIGLFPAVIFGVGGWFGEKDRLRRAEAIQLLRDQLEAPSLTPPGPDARTLEAEPGQAGIDDVR